MDDTTRRSGAAGGGSACARSSGGYAACRSFSCRCESARREQEESAKVGLLCSVELATPTARIAHGQCIATVTLILPTMDAPYNHVADEQSAKNANQLEDWRPCDAAGTRASPSGRPTPPPHCRRCGYRTRVDDPWLFNHGRRRPRHLGMESRLLGGGPAAPASDIEPTHLQYPLERMRTPWLARRSLWPVQPLKLAL
jgi:hypothetical protein